MQLTCPCCHSRFGIEAALQGDAGRELLALLAGIEPAVARPLFAYLGLFRASKTQLSWDRALRLAREVLQLGDAAVLAAALTETVAAMDEKRATPSWKPLTSHNYLRRVLESTAARFEASPGMSHAPEPIARVPKSKAGQALVALEGMKR